MSGRLRTLTEMFHAADRKKGELFQITPYAKQSDQNYNERTGKMTVTELNSARVGAVLKVAQLHGFKETESCILTPSLSHIGSLHWTLSRK